MMFFENLGTAVALCSGWNCVDMFNEGVIEHVNDNVTSLVKPSRS
jgi:hypothetical protein